MLFVFTHIYFTPEFLQSLLVDLVMALYHVIWLLGVERVGDGAQHEDIELYSLFAFLLFAFLFLLQLGLCESLLAG